MLRRFEISKRFFRFLPALLLLLISATFTPSQKLPKSIRGYKVHNASVLLTTSKPKASEINNSTVVVDIGTLKVSRASLFGLTIEAIPKITTFGRKGEIDFIVFEGFKINGLNVKIEEYAAGFAFKKSKTVTLVSPIRTYISTSETIRGAAKELVESKKEWRIRGRALVFGRFKKSIFGFKRVIPIDVDITVENPIKILK